MRSLLTFDRCLRPLSAARFVALAALVLHASLIHCDNNDSHTTVTEAANLAVTAFIEQHNSSSRSSRSDHDSFATTTTAAATVNLTASASIEQLDVVTAVLTSLGNLSEATVEVHEMHAHDRHGHEFTLGFKLAYAAIVLGFLLLALPSVILLNAFTLLLLDSLAVCFRYHNPSLFIYRKLTLLDQSEAVAAARRKAANVGRGSGSSGKKPKDYIDPVELKHFNYCYASDVPDFLKDDAGGSDGGNWTASTPPSIGRHAATSRRPLVNSFGEAAGQKQPSGSMGRSGGGGSGSSFDCQPYATFSSQHATVQELDRIERHLSKSIDELDEWHRTLASATQSQAAARRASGVDMRQADELINDLIDELNMEQDIDARLQRLEIVEPPAAPLPSVTAVDEVVKSAADDK